MPPESILIAPSAAFWTAAARTLLQHPVLTTAGGGQNADCSALRVVVPTMEHARLLKAALRQQGRGTFVLPRISTLSAWLALQPPAADQPQPDAASQRLMALYGELRQHAWLKKLFSARRNTDLLPLAKTLLCLSDELTQSLLPQQRLAPEDVAARWQGALEQLTPSARHILSDEAQLVWTIWQNQLAGNDACATRFLHMMRIADQADAPLAWIAPVAPDAFEQAFLDAYATQQPVLSIQIDWQAAAIHPGYVAAWPELVDDAAEPRALVQVPPAGLALCQAASLESEALQGAQTVIDWLAAGKSSIAIIAQDRVAARRIRALLERAQIVVADETGWKLSTTRAAAAIAALFEVIVSRAETIALLDLLKSPYLCAELADKPALLMQIEDALRRANVLGGWEAATAVLHDAPNAQALVARIAAQAARFSHRKTVLEWLQTTQDTLEDLGMRAALLSDAAGLQVMALLQALQHDCRHLGQVFSFAEWRTLVGLQLESTDFLPAQNDRRVVMLPLNGARLRSFDAVLLVGADAEHLPSAPAETLFFANAVRRELGLSTRESLQRQQLRDFTELLSVNAEVVLSWQAQRDGEPNPLSPWLERLQLALAGARLSPLKDHQAALTETSLTPHPQRMPSPAAPQLLPTKLSASGYNQLVACPYQFFAKRMLGLASLDELSDLPQKRDYGDWLHKILKKYHDRISQQSVGISERGALLREISEDIFGPVMLRNPAALGYYVRWQKAQPAYLDWANEREAQGWRFEAGEQWLEKTLQWDGGEVLLHGCIDRIDADETNQCAVLDYKATGHALLKKRLDQREDHQLAFYGLLADRPVDAAHYVALELYKDTMRDVEAPRYGEWQQRLGSQIVDNLRAISQGAPLTASGIETACQYCDVRGLCRKGAW